MGDYIKYPKGDIRRFFNILHALSTEDMTLIQLEKVTGHNRGTINIDIKHIREQMSVDISKEGAVYSLVNLGPIIKLEGLDYFYKNMHKNK